MDVVVGYESALAFWRTVGPSLLGDGKARRNATLRAQKALAAEGRPRLEGGNRRPAGCTLPVHVLVGRDTVRVRTKSVASSVCSSLPQRSVVDAGTGFLICSPEFVFLQMAASLTLVQLIQLGFELCGTYSLAENGPARTRRAPLTAVAKLKAFVEANQNVPGRVKALRALRYCMDGSAPPPHGNNARLVALFAIRFGRVRHRETFPQLPHRCASGHEEGDGPIVLQGRPMLAESQAVR